MPLFPEPPPPPTAHRAPPGSAALVRLARAALAYAHAPTEAAGRRVLADAERYARACAPATAHANARARSERESGKRPRPPGRTAAGESRVAGGSARPAEPPARSVPDLSWGWALAAPVAEAVAALRSAGARVEVVEARLVAEGPFACGLALRALCFREEEAVGFLMGE